jgi:hypothetical protein
MLRALGVVEMSMRDPEPTHGDDPTTTERRIIRLADAGLTCAVLPLVVSAALAAVGIGAREPRFALLVVMALPLAVLGWLGRSHPAPVGAFLVIAGSLFAVGYPLVNAGLPGEIVVAVETGLLLPAVAAGLLFLRLGYQLRSAPGHRPSGVG